MEKRKYKIGFKHYFKPTPERIKRLGNALFTTAIAFSTFSYVLQNQTAGMVIFAVGAVGKFITEFFTEE